MHGMQAYQITQVASILSCSCMPTSYYPEYLSQTAYKKVIPFAFQLYMYRTFQKSFEMLNFSINKK